MKRKIYSVQFKLFIAIVVVLIAGLTNRATAQTIPELETAKIQMGHIWTGVMANAEKGIFNYGGAGFFPNDYDILGNRVVGVEAIAGGGIQLSMTHWQDIAITDSAFFHDVVVFGPTSRDYDGWQRGKVVDNLTNYIRYTYPKETVDFEEISLTPFGTQDPSKFNDGTFDQVVEVTSEYIIGVQMHRRFLAWSQNYHNDYIIIELTFTNATPDTIHDFYINMQLNGKNTVHSYGTNPSPQGNIFDPSFTWQHYYGGRVGDSLRVFYEYGADDPDQSGDNMGGPAISQNGRLLNAKFLWYSILHASATPFSDSANDQDDFLQPKVTYLGKDNLIPFSSEANDEFGSKNFYALSGGFSEDFPMSGDTWPETFHGVNNDEMGSPDFDAHVAMSRLGNDSRMWSSFGPYTFPPGEKVRVVYAVGYSGLSIETGKSVGYQWVKKTLPEPPGLPNPVTGYFPDNFAFPAGASEMDKIKDRWVSTGIDSVMKSAYRAKWNYEHGYKVPQAPPPPEKVTVTAKGTGVDIRWSDIAAEQMDDFAGYRIMRRVSNLDTVFYEPVYSSGPEDIADEHVFTDTQVLLGGQYYYYIQAKAQIDENDPNAYPDNRGKILYSARVLEPNFKNTKPVHPTQNDLRKIRVVPNPYNINDPMLEAYGNTDLRYMQFVNLPPTITIKIFTENGDLVRVLEHDSLVDSGNEDWDMLTSSQQVINSGVYIAVFEAPDGSISYQKFLVVR